MCGRFDKGSVVAFGSNEAWARSLVKSQAVGSAGNRTSHDLGYVFYRLYKV
jgi:hypothetical protein